MNRIILIGNGFDLAHGLPTSYGNFIDWYWDKWQYELRINSNNTVKDELCEISLKDKNKGWLAYAYNNLSRLYPHKGREFYEYLKENIEVDIRLCEFLKSISKSIETKGWVDIENEYYNLLIKCLKHEIFELNHQMLNEQLGYLRSLLMMYLKELDIESVEPRKTINDIIYGPINPNDISVNKTQTLNDHITFWVNQDDKTWENRFKQYERYAIYSKNGIEEFIYKQKMPGIKYNTIDEHINPYFLLPDNILFLNFNYTTTPYRYVQKNNPWFQVNHIHGELTDPNSVIFGYGDELDENYKKISNLNDNEYLKNFKSIKYLESDSYRKALQFMDAEPYQVYILGHSCGNSDRTFLNTLFEHENCVSIKPYYFKNGDKDNYLDIVQNISRNFTDMKLMRDRVVNKTYCKPFSER